MAGIRCFYRNLLVFNTSRLTDRNGVLLQLTRKRHNLVFQISSLQKEVFFDKRKLMYDANRLLLYRLVSTNVTELKEPVSISALKVSEVKSHSNQPNKEATQLNNEPVQSSKGPDIVESANPNIIDESLLPPPPSEVAEAASAPVVDFVSMGLKEPSFESLGLGSWWPPGLIQQVLEFLHVNMNLPWWESILIITFVIRCFMLPINVKTRKESIELTNCHMPNIMNYNEKIKQAKLQGDYYAVALHNQELQKYVKENNISFFGFFKVALIQGPIFISIYYALSGMAQTPVESLKTGGLFWFQDLTQPDPYYILPLILSASLFAVIETGAEGNPNMTNKNFVKWVFRGLSGVVFLLTLKFAACLTWYWSVSNIISLGTVALFKVPAIKKFLKLPDVNQNSIQLLKKQNKGFMQEVKEGIENAKIASEYQNREKMNLISLQKAGSGPVPRTFKKNPLLQNAKKSS